MKIKEIGPREGRVSLVRPWIRQCPSLKAVQMILEFNIEATRFDSD